MSDDQDRSTALEYVERVPRIAFGKGVVKFTFVRREPTSDKGENDPFVMVGVFAMPDEYFAETAIFFESAVRDLVRKGRISKERLSELREIFAEGADEED